MTETFPPSVLDGSESSLSDVVKIDCKTVVRCQEGIEKQPFNGLAKKLGA